MAQNTDPQSAYGALDDILAQRRVDKHNQTLDGLNLLNTQSEMANRAQNTQSIAEERAARTADLKGKSDAQDQYHAAVKAFIDSPDFTKFDPATQSMLKVGAMDPDNSLFKTIANQYLAGSNKPQGGNVLVIGRNGQVTDSGVYAEPGQPVKEQPAPQQTNAANSPVVYTHEDPDNPGHLIANWLRPGEQPSEANRIKATGVHKGDYKPPPPPKQPTINPTLLSRAQGARKELEGSVNSGMPGLGWGAKPRGDDGKRAVYNEAAIGAAGSILSGAPLKAFSDVMNDPTADPYSSAQIAAGHTDLTEPDRVALQDALARIRGK